MKYNKETAQSPKELLHDLQELISEAEAMVADSVASHPIGTIESLCSRLTAAQERFTDAYAGARKKVVAGAKYTDETIRANPYQSLAIAAGLGLVLGALLGRRKK
jgi:ElaB/YqjD/DUF883 family membrane-anchored ribosome-binding protein